MMHTKTGGMQGVSRQETAVCFVTLCCKCRNTLNKRDESFISVSLTFLLL